MEWNMENGGGNSHRGTEHGTWRMEHPSGTEHATRWVELSLWNGTWNTAGGNLIVERNMEHSG